MNFKTFGVAVVFLVGTLVWLGFNIYWIFTKQGSVFDLVVAAFFALAGVGMVYNELGKKKRRHLEDVNKSQIP